MGASLKRVGIVLLGTGALILGLYLQKKLDWHINFKAVLPNPGFCSSDAVYWRHMASGNDVISYFYTLLVIFIDAYCGRIEVPDKESRFIAKETFQSNKNPYDSPTPNLLQAREFILGRRTLLNNIKVRASD
jgi:hypothetical protein